MIPVHRQGTPLSNATRGWLLCAAVLAISAGTFPAAADPGVQWEPWSAAAFQRAQRENKLIFVDVGTEWCGACQKQESVTYADPGVIATLNSHFINIKVDAEVQPDVGELYSAWGWPALIFLLPDGTQVNEFAGNRAPERFKIILDTVLARQREGTLGEWKTTLAEGADPAREDLALLYRRVTAQLDRSYDAANGGWGKPAKSPLPHHVEQALFRAHIDRDESQWRARALDTLERTIRLLDPVWGGVYAAGRDDWSLLAPEKIGWKQAGIIQNFAEAYQLTADGIWREHLYRTRAYLDRFLQAPDGSYYNSQDPFRRTGHADFDPGYYRLDDARRRALGIPDIDRTVHTDVNGRLVVAYVHAFAATGDRSWLEAAERLGAVLIAKRRTDAGWYRQLVIADAAPVDRRVRELPSASANDPVIYLRTQAWMGRALVSLYGATGDGGWFSHAVELEQAMTERLRDPGSGGFFARQPLDAGPALLPVADNALAAMFLHDLAYYIRPGGDTRLLAIAEGALRAVGGEEKIRREGKMVAEYALALKRLLSGPVEFSVVGDIANPVARELFDVAVRTYEPRRILKFEKPGRYPDLGHPALYVCTRVLCSKPIGSAADVNRAVADFQSLVALSER